ncbi:MAG TPA: diadenosine tetraphosphate hydrolase [Candidatus Moranbacteria bacterium]|nr:diadenosine tetraphosphate hydrolase [Candidatus Moranbacteria bacterium]HBT45478.1 diadenosine tetraphosphate hydrolase [Candidatus Moranbacteria bacterium]
MYNHAPENYNCPICLGVNGIESDATMLKQADIVYKDDLVCAFVNSKFVGNNPGHVIVVPNEHFENLYDMPEDVLSRAISVSKKIAIAMKKARNCDGVMIQQNNEPASNQHAFHYHMHVFPRFDGDEIYQHMNSARVSDPQERIAYAEELKKYLN